MFIRIGTLTCYFYAQFYFTCRLHKEALKQAATDPKTGIIDVGILTTGVSSSERQRRETLAKELHKILQSKCRGGAPLKQLEMFEVMKEQSQSVRREREVIHVHVGK